MSTGEGVILDDGTERVQSRYWGLASSLSITYDANGRPVLGTTGGGGVTSPGGTPNTVAKFTAAQVIGDSSITDTGTLVSTTSAVQITGSYLRLQHATAPILVFRELDQTLPAGLWRMPADGATLRIDRNTAAGGDFSTYTTPLKFAADDKLLIGGDDVNLYKGGANELKTDDNFRVAGICYFGQGFVTGNWQWQDATIDLYDDTGSSNYIQVRTVSDTGTSYLIVARARAGPTFPSAGDLLGSITYRGYDGAWTDEGASVRATAQQTWTASVHGTRLGFYVTPNGAAVPNEAIRIAHDGGLWPMLATGTQNLGDSTKEWSDFYCETAHISLALNLTGAGFTIGSYTLAETAILELNSDDTQDQLINMKSDSALYGFSFKHDDSASKLVFNRHENSSVGTEWLKVERTTGGATFYGDITIDRSQPRFNLDRDATTEYAMMGFRNIGTIRWNIGMNADAAGDFSVWRYNDAGAFQDRPIVVYRSTGVVQFANAVNAYNSLYVRGSAAAGYVYVGQDGQYAGYLVLYGPGAGNQEGGEARFYFGADYDTTEEFAFIDAYNDRLRFGVTSKSVAYFDVSDDLWYFTENVRVTTGYLQVVGEDATIYLGNSGGDPGQGVWIWDGTGDRMYWGFSGSNGGSLQWYAGGTATSASMTLSHGGTLTLSTGTNVLVQSGAYKFGGDFTPGTGDQCIYMSGASLHVHSPGYVFLKADTDNNGTGVGIAFYVDGSQQLLIDETGLNIQSNLVPDLATRTLGDATTQWGTLYVDKVYLAIDGAVGTPGYTWEADPNTGIYRVGEGQMGFSSNGNLRLAISSTIKPYVNIVPNADDMGLGDATYRFFAYFSQALFYERVRCVPQTWANREQVTTSSANLSFTTGTGTDIGNIRVVDLNYSGAITLTFTNGIEGMVIIFYIHYTTAPTSVTISNADYGDIGAPTWSLSTTKKDRVVVQYYDSDYIVTVTTGYDDT